MPFTVLRATLINTVILLVVFLLSIPELFVVSGSVEGRLLTKVDFQQVLNTDVIWQVVGFIFSIILIYSLFIVVLSVGQYYLLRNCRFSTREKYFISSLGFIFITHWLILLNQWFYPLSMFRSAFFFEPGSTGFGLYIAAIAMIIVVLVLYAIYRMLSRFTPKPFPIFSGVVVLLAALPFSSYLGAYLGLFHQAHSSSVDRPNIVLIGVDSLRYDLLNYSDKGIASEYTPHMARFFEQSVVFHNAYTPMGRTHVALSSLYTGAYPYKHGIRYNLTPDKYRNPDIPWLPQTLGQVGYRTYFGLDDRRFASIGHKDGFDKVVGPERGASDYILGMMNDNPLSNLINLFGVAKYIFPYSYANRGVAQLYHPEFFVNEMAKATEEDTSASRFISVHFTLPHWPYFWASASPIKTQEDIPTGYLRYLDSMKVTDDLFQNYMDQLQQQGILENAIVVLYSDHGEAWATTDPLTLVEEKAGYEFPSSRGHGTNVLSDHQVKIVVAFKRYGGQPYTPKVSHQLVSLVDVSPTLLDILGMNKNPEVDGISLLPWIENANEPIMDRYVFTESGLNFKALEDIDNNLDELLKQGLKAYQFSQNGEYFLKPDIINDIIHTKQYAVFSNEGAIGFFPNGQKDYFIKRHSVSEVGILADNELDNEPMVQALKQRIAEANYPVAD